MLTAKQFLQFQQPLPPGKVYIVTNQAGCMVGYESLIIMHVPNASEAVFQKQYKGRILIEGSSPEEVRAKFNELLST